MHDQLVAQWIFGDGLDVGLYIDVFIQIWLQHRVLLAVDHRAHFRLLKDYRWRLLDRARDDCFYLYNCIIFGANLMLSCRRECRDLSWRHFMIWVEFKTYLLGYWSHLSGGVMLIWRRDSYQKLLCGSGLQLLFLHCCLEIKENLIIKFEIFKD